MTGAALIERRRRIKRRLCAACGCPHSERNMGCSACSRRHSGYKQHGKPYVAGPPRGITCVGCGVQVDQITEGCEACYRRHQSRKYRGDAFVEYRSKHELKHPVPAAPIHALLEEHIAKKGMMATERLIYGYRPGPKGNGRLAKIMAQRRLTFELADRILCSLDMPELWHMDPDLSAIYSSELTG